MSHRSTIHRDETGAKGLRQFLDDEQQRTWLEGEATPVDAAERQDSLEQRFQYAGRLEKLLGRPQAADVIAILRAYAATCLPVPRATERFYWSVSCLPSTDKSFARINASWMELLALQPCPESSRDAVDRRSTADGDGLKARFILHLSDFTTDCCAAATLSPGGRGQGEGVSTSSTSAVAPHPNPLPAGEREMLSGDPATLDVALLKSCVDRPENVTHFFWKADTFGVKVRGTEAIRTFMSHPHSLRAIRRFNLTHMNRGRNAYQASHCYSLADRMLDE